jgi:hypothetical protein
MAMSKNERSTPTVDEALEDVRMALRSLAQMLAETNIRVERLRVIVKRNLEETQS